MNAVPAPTVVLVPGLRDHVAGHWQTELATLLPGAVTVPPLTEAGLSRDAQVTALDDTLSGVAGPVVLVAHSAGVLTTVHWAARHHRPVRGALLATPPDFDTPLPDGYPGPRALSENGWLPTPRIPLPFPSVVAASTNDPLARFGQVAELARAWGSRLADIGPVGHLNPASGYGPWPQALEFLDAFGCRTTPQPEASA
nr:alpha/beta fold hydrolase [Streptomyces sp. NBC_00995]